MARTACLVCFISTVPQQKQEEAPLEIWASSGHITNLKQSILTFDIYGLHTKEKAWDWNGEWFENKQKLWPRKRRGRVASLMTVFNCECVIEMPQIYVL